MAKQIFPPQLIAILIMSFVVACATTPGEETAGALDNNFGQTVVSDVISAELPTAAPVVETATPAVEPTPVIQPTDTQVPPPTATPGPTETPWPTPPPTWTPSPPPLNTPRPIPTGPGVIAADAGTYCVVGVESDDLLMIRAEPDHTSEILGGIPPFGQNVMVDDAAAAGREDSWIEIDYYGRVGWVNATFLGRQYGSVDEAVSMVAIEALGALRSGDMVSLSALAHPESGVIIAPGSYLEESSLSFSAEDIATLWDDETEFTWGYDSGTGEPIEMPFKTYYDKFLYSEDFFFADAIGFDEVIRSGNLIDNSKELFPDSHAVEYHFDGFDPQFDGLDYRTLRIILDDLDGQYYLVALTLGQWTP